MEQLLPAMANNEMPEGEFKTNRHYNPGQADSNECLFIQIHQEFSHHNVNQSDKG